MLKHIVIAFAMLCLSVTASFAAGSVDPQCTSMNDKVGCTCAVRTGGYVAGDRWYKSRTGDALAKFAACTGRHESAQGGCNGTCQLKCQQYASRYHMTYRECIVVFGRLNQHYGPARTTEVASHWTRTACEFKCDAVWRRTHLSSAASCKKQYCGQYPND